MKTTQSGAAIVEFALVLPLLLLLTMITTEFGRAIYQYNTLVKSLRGAARYLSVQTPSTPLTPNTVAITEAKNLVVYGSVTPGTIPLVPNLTTDMVTPTWQTTGSNPLINYVTITVTRYTFYPLVTGVFGTTFGNIPYPDISATMRSPS